ncbi:MAG TPA: ABC transporter ATP-binding protein [Ktedonobacterales bacterium]|jgi:ABC-2 type transport system ATP-binding protein|nr:ABC transporter ATP-binding protein [Ktedonobacterales bacterium]
MTSAIQCVGLTKRYGAITALDNLRLDVPQGAVFGLLGPNGAGKTTLVRLLTGLARPTAGSATVAGYDIATGGVDLRKRMSVLEQQPNYYTWMKGRELLAFTGQLFGLRGAELRARVAEVLATTGLSDAANRGIGGYSGGMRQRLGLAQALMNRPEVLFLDEPASALDPAGRYEILQSIAELRGQATVFMSTHILGDVERICDHVAILNHGKLIVSATVTDLQERYARPTYEIELEPHQAEGAATLEALLRAAPWADGVARDHDILRVGARDTRAAAYALAPLCAQAGVALTRLERGRPSLEEIFLRLVGESAAPETPGTQALQTSRQEVV